MELGLYVAVSDLLRAKSFYSALFAVEPYVENDNFVGFEISGGRFGLMKESSYAYPMARGNNVVPNMRVPDAQMMFDRIKLLEPSMDSRHKVSHEKRLDTHRLMICGDFSRRL